MNCVQYMCGFVCVEYVNASDLKFICKFFEMLATPLRRFEWHFITFHLENDKVSANGTERNGLNEKKYFSKFFSSWVVNFVKFLLFFSYSYQCQWFDWYSINSHEFWKRPERMYFCVMRKGCSLLEEWCMYIKLPIIIMCSAFFNN